MSKSSSWLIGPVVGMVEETKGRILVEAASSVSAKVEASIDGGVVCSIMVNIQARSPTIVVVDRLQAGKEVAVSIELGGEKRRATFRTPSAKGDWKIGAISCNNIAHMRDIGLWPKLAKEAGTLDYLIHMGDQIYGDETYFRSVNSAADIDKRQSTKSAWAKCSALISNANPKTYQTLRPQLLEFYREVYRETWNYPPVAATLASVSNVMVADDHEVVDDLGDLPEHSDPSSWQYYVIGAAYQVYMEYQLQLARPVDVTDPNTKSYHPFTIGGPRGIGVFLLDCRIEHSLHKEANMRAAGGDWKGKDYLGPAQWQAMRASLSRDFADCRLVLMVSPTPPLFLNSVATTLAGVISNDVRGSWGATRFRKEQLAFLRLLSDWQQAKGGRMVTMLAGDIHVGGFTDCQVMDNAPLVNQMISSAVGNLPSIKLAGAAKAVLELSEGDDKLKVDHHEWVMEPNYGTLAIALDTSSGDGDGKPPTLKGTLVSVKGTVTHPMRYKLGAFEEAVASPNCSCCAIQ